MPHMPVSTVSGRKIVDITVSTFITWFRRLETVERCASRMPVTRSWNRIASSDEPHEVVVDVAEAIGHLVGDRRKLPARQAADRVALRDQHAPQRRQVALQREHLAHQSSRVPGTPLPRACSIRVLERLDLRPVVVDHRVDDAVQQRDRALGQDALVLLAHLRAAWRCCGSGRREP